MQKEKLTKIPYKKGQKRGAFSITMKETKTGFVIEANHANINKIVEAHTHLSNMIERILHKENAK